MKNKIIRKFLQIVLILILLISKSYCQIDLCDLFLNNKIDTCYSSMRHSLSGNDLLLQIEENKYKLKNTTSDPLLFREPELFDTSLVDQKNNLVIPDSTEIKLNYTEIEGLPPSKNSIFEIEVNRYINNIEYAHFIYNLILEKLLTKIEINPKTHSSIINNSGVVEISSTGMIYEIEQNNKVLLYLTIVYRDFGHLRNNGYIVRLNYSVYNYK